MTPRTRIGSKAVSRSSKKNNVSIISLQYELILKEKYEIMPCHDDVPVMFDFMMKVFENE